MSPASAASLEKKYSNSFEKAWELNAIGDNNKAVLTYGYNTFLINEDYAWAYHSTKEHYASLKNSNGWHTGSSKGKGKTSKIKVRHKGSSIIYRCNW